MLKKFSKSVMVGFWTYDFVGNANLANSVHFFKNAPIKLKIDIQTKFDMGKTMEIIKISLAPKFEFEFLPKLNKIHHLAIFWKSLQYWSNQARNGYLE